MYFITVGQNKTLNNIPVFPLMLLIKLSGYG